MCEECDVLRRRLSSAFADNEKIILAWIAESRKRTVVHLCYCILLIVLITLFGLVTFAHATDIGCGRDTDRNGSVDNYCPGDDQDFDGYSTAQGDCDDTNWQIFPGTLTSSGCASGSFRKCGSDGSGYTSCKALSSMVASDIDAKATRLFWLSAGGSTALHAGATYSDPADFRCIGDTTYNDSCRSDIRDGTNDIPAGTAFLLLGGNYTTYFTAEGNNYQLSVAYSPGSAAHPIYLQGDPTSTVNFQNPGTGIGFKVTSVILYESTYVVLDKIKVSGGYGHPVYLSGSDHVTATRLDVMDVGGNGGSENLAGVNATFTNTEGHGYTSISHSYIDDVYNRSDPTNYNNSCIVLFEGQNNAVNYNVCTTSRTGGAGAGIKYKHSKSFTTYDWIGNYIYNTALDCLETCAPHGRIKNNLLVSCGTDGTEQCIQIADVGGGCYFNDIVIENNTCVDGNILNFNPTTDYASIGDPAITFQKNVVVDSKASYSCEGTNQCPVNISNYGTNANYTDIMTTGSNSGKKFVIANNCWYNSASTAFSATVFRNNDSPKTLGETYSSWNSWVSAGIETGSFNENPNLNTIKNATSSNCSNYGYLGNITTSSTSSTIRTGAVKQGRWRN